MPTTAAPTSRAETPVERGVAGNARLTGAFGAVIFVLLAVEGARSRPPPAVWSRGWIASFHPLRDH